MNLSRDYLDPVITHYFSIESVTEGRDRNRSYLRYSGHFLQEDTAFIHSELMNILETDEITPLFRTENGQPVLYLVEGLPKPKPGKPWINLVLFVLTMFSVLMSGALYAMDAETASSGNLWNAIFSHLGDGWPFAISLMAILVTHELGHYFAGKYHKTEVTLPYFIPFPLSSFGTMGAFIQMKGIPRNRNHLLDIGIAGPLAGLAVTIPVLLIGLSLSTVQPLPTATAAGQAMQLEGNSLLYLLLKFAAKGQLLPAPVDYGGTPPFLYWLKYFFTGQPIPWGGMDVMLHPVAWAGWVGLLVTSLNLIPAGQLDGGHIFYSLFGTSGMKKAFPAIVIVLSALGWFWNGWWLWVVLILLLGRTSAEPLDQITPLDKKHKRLGYFGILVFILVFMPIPIVTIGM